MEYLIKRARVTPELRGDWDGPAWRDAQVAEISSFHPAGSDHRPQTAAKILYDDAGLYVIFRVRDRYVVCTRDKHQTLTSKDSCVEVYFESKPGEKGYLNFEMNCGGTLLLFYITDPTRSQETIFREKVVVPEPLIDTMRIYHSLPKTLPREIAEPVEWAVEYFVPWSLFETYAGKLEPPAQRRWRGNFHKCADESSHPHWASWSPIGEELNFHVPQYFCPDAFRGVAPLPLAPPVLPLENSPVIASRISLRASSFRRPAARDFFSSSSACRFVLFACPMRDLLVLRPGACKSGSALSEA